MKSKQIAMNMISAGPQRFVKTHGFVKGMAMPASVLIFIMDINNLHMTGGVLVKVLMMVMMMMVMVMVVVVRMVNLMRAITIPMTIGIITTMILSGLLHIEKCHLLFFRISMCVLS
jgi:hypothetical protein